MDAGGCFWIYSTDIKTKNQKIIDIDRERGRRGRDGERGRGREIARHLIGKFGQQLLFTPLYSPA